MQAQLMNFGWSSTYIGAVSYMKLVFTTTTLGDPVHSSRFALGASRRRRAHSMLEKRSPMFAPTAMAAICGRDFEEEDEAVAPELGDGCRAVDGAAGSTTLPEEGADDEVAKSSSVRLTSTSADSAPRIALGLDIRTVNVAVLSSRKESTVCATSDARASTVRYLESSTNWDPVSPAASKKQRHARRISVAPVYGSPAGCRVKISWLSRR